MRKSLPCDIAAESRALLRDFAILGTLATCALGVVYLCLVRWAPLFPKDGSSLVVGRDFVNFWMYGRAALAPAAYRFYDPQIYNHALQSFLGANYPGQNWSYPPDIMLLAAPFGLLGYLPALLCWTLVGLGILLWTARARLHAPASLWSLFAAPAVAFCLMFGQSSLLATAALIAIFAWLDRRPVWAGILIGLLTLKPQLGFLFPVMLCASGRWRVFSVATATALALVVLTTLIFGTQVWMEYLHLGIPVQNTVLTDPRMLAAPFMPTIFMNAHAAGASYSTSMIVQACVSLLADATVFWIFLRHRHADQQMLQALFLACSVAATPYLLSYDTLPLVFAGIVLLASGALDALGRRLVQLIFWLPFIQLGLGNLHIPGAALVAPAFAVYLACKIAGVKLFTKPAAAHQLP
jgi:hypothetical protein